MAMTSIGDMAQLLISRQTNTTIKQKLNTLTNEMSSGTVNDVSAHLRSRQASLSMLDRNLQRLDGFSTSISEMEQILEISQTSFKSILSESDSVSQQMVLIENNTSETQVNLASDRAMHGLETVINRLNVQVAGRSVFGGSTTSHAAVVSADELMNQVRTAITDSSATDASAIEAAVEDWFSSAIGFDDTAYLGENQNRKHLIAEDQDVDLVIRADSDAVKQVLSALAIGIVASDASVSSVDARILTRTAGKKLLSAASGIASLQGQVGHSQETVETAKVSNAAMRAAWITQRNDLVSIDQYETAAELKNMQTQLEIHYTLTARMSSLSLARYL